MASYAEKITDMNAEAIYKFLKNLPEKANIDKLSDSVHTFILPLSLLSLD